VSQSPIPERPPPESTQTVAVTSDDSSVDTEATADQTGVNHENGAA
jgi:hypothetical protein